MPGGGIHPKTPGLNPGAGSNKHGVVETHNYASLQHHVRWAMVRMFGIRQYPGGFQAFFQVIGNADVIDASTLVIGPRIGPKTPPGITMGLGVKFTERVNHTAFKPFIHPGALLG